MYSLDKAKKQIVKAINDALGEKLIQASDFVFPPNQEMGDLSLPCFELGKKLKKTPVETAEWIVSNMRIGGMVVGLKSTGPYINFTLNKAMLAKDVLGQIGKTGDEYGSNNRGKHARVMIEYSNANTHKEYHVGHLRNICYGEAVNRILSANGYKSIPVSYINDFGIHVAKTLWAYIEFYKDKKPPKNKGGFLGEIYSFSAKKLEKEPLAKEKVIFMMKKIESRKGEEYKLWRKTRKWSIEQMNRIYQELEVKFDHIFYESDFVESGMDMVAKLYKKEFLVKSEGAVIADLSQHDLGVLLFLRSDGTALYPVADLPLAVEKFKEYKLDKSIYVVDVRQSLYFKQLFKALELLGHKQEMIHLGYEFVKLPSGMMQSRSGNIITYDDLREQVLKRAESETRERHKDWSKEKIGAVATVITNGALKFEMIKVGAGQVITFDINKAMRFDGFTAAYLQYTYARIISIIRKYNANAANYMRMPRIANNANKTKSMGVDFSNLVEVKEHGLVMNIAKYPEVVVKAGENYDPSEVAKYLFELARDFNEYYHSVPVLKALKEIRDARVELIGAVRGVIKNGLDLLGIGVVEEM